MWGWPKLIPDTPEQAENSTASSTGYGSSTLPAVASTEQALVGEKNVLSSLSNPASNESLTSLLEARRRPSDGRIPALTEEALKKALSTLSQDHAAGLDTKAATRNAGSRCGSQMNSRQASRDRRQSGSRAGSLGSRTGLEGLPPARSNSRNEVCADPDRAASRDQIGSRSSCIHSDSGKNGSAKPLRVNPATVAIVLDWDDTLCPTTWLREDCGVDWTVPLSEFSDKTSERNRLIARLVQTHLKCVKEFLLEASRHGTVILVTLAKRPWVEISLQNWMPDLLTTFQECAVCIVYAQDFINEGDRARVSSTTTNVDSNVEVRIWTQAKELGVLDRLQDSSTEWAHVLSIGDSEFERMGVRQAAMKLTSTCFTKTLKLMEDPSIEELTAELIMLRVWLPYLVERMGDFDDEIDSPDDVKLQDLHFEVTGETDHTLSWEVLAGLT